MRRSMWRFRFAAAGSALALAFAVRSVAAGEGDSPPDFAHDVLPVFEARCVSCHGPVRRKGGLRLDRRAEAVAGGASGAVIVPGDAAASRLYRAVAGLDPELRMPYREDPLTPEEVGRIRRWIDGGAPWPDDGAPSRHWAFAPPVRPPVPAVERQDWVRTEVDAFIARAHELAGLVAAPEAPRRVLIRRLYLDLAGVPPPPGEVVRFLADRSPFAWEKLVDRVLSSPEYGERWGRHWLDLARFAETEGYEGNTFRTSVWRYRDYVIASFACDRPYDLFLRQQIAGDEMEPYSDENIVATGFLSSARFSHNEEDKAIQRNDPLVDVANATASVTLGLTLNCAQCHDHRFDPLSIRDYYRFQGFFVRGQLNYVLLKDPSLWAAYKRELPEEYRTARAEKARLEETARARALGAEEMKRLAQLGETLGKLENELRERKPQMWAFYSPVSSPHAMDVLPPKDVFPLPYQPEELARTTPCVLARGDPHQRGEALDAGWPEVFGPTPPGLLGGKPRLALADWLASRTNPLTARVWVNAIWKRHFGRGLVATPGDFGTHGVPPTHPELLDWLAVELLESGWSTKHIHRGILLSSTYRQASVPDPRAREVDPDARLLWRWSPRRLEAEILRDAALAASGELERAMGGSSTPPEEWEGSLRRSVYLRQVRGKFPPFQAHFDGPSANESCHGRHVSTTALQSLFLINGPFMVRRADAVARRVIALAGPDEPERIGTAFELVLGREPSATEAAAAERLLRAADGEDAGADPPRGLIHLCHALLNSNEFAYLE